jgi:hypothetical protein
MSNVYSHKFSYDFKKSEPEEIEKNKQIYHEMRHEVLSHILKISNNLGMPMYLNTNNGNIITDSHTYTHAFKPITSVEKLEQIYDNQQYADIYLPHPFGVSLVLACLQEKKEVKEWFFRHSDMFLSMVPGREFNDYIKYIASSDILVAHTGENDSQKTLKEELLVNLIVHSGNKMGKISLDSVEETISLLSTHLSYPTNTEALALYLFTHRDEFSGSGVTNLLQEKIIKALESHQPENLNRFHFLDFVKKYHQSQTVVFDTDNIESTLRVKIDYENIINYLALKGLSNKEVKDWMKVKIFSSMQKALEDSPEYFALHSIEHAVQDDNHVNLYLNLKKGSSLTHDAITQSLVSLFNNVRAQSPKSLLELYELSQNYMASYWLKEKISNQIENHEDIASDTSASPRNKI